MSTTSGVSFDCSNDATTAQVPPIPDNNRREWLTQAIETALPTGYSMVRLPAARRSMVESARACSPFRASGDGAMQGDVVKAAKWLSAGMIVASFILVVGLHPMVTGRILTVTKVQPESAAPPVPGSY